MQASTELTSSPSWTSDFEDEFAEAAGKIAEEFTWKLKINGGDVEKTEESTDSDDDVDDKGDDEDFSFACLGADGSPISADDAFQNGQIRPVFPLFDQSLLYAGDSVPLKDDLPRRPPVKKVFVETEESSSSVEVTRREKGESASPYCVWSGKAVEASPDVCKKSNSTGSSKLWRFRDLLSRSSSDGRDAFVFLNSSTTASTSSKAEKRETSLEKKMAGVAKANGAGANLKAKKGGKGKPTSLSAHELHYVKTRALRGEDRRRSYLPYRPELVGFFTNVHGGLSKNVHPF